MEYEKITQEQKGVRLKITKIYDSTPPDEYVDVYVLAESGDEKGHSGRFRYFTRKPYTDHNGKEKKGSFWKFKNLAIACGLFVIDDNKHKQLPESFTSKDLEDKTFIADLEIFNGWLGPQKERQDVPENMIDDKAEPQRPIQPDSEVLEEDVPF